VKPSGKPEQIQVPSTFELAQIAVQIAQLPTEHTREFSYLAHMAFEMWQACNEERNRQIDRLKLRAEAIAKDQAESNQITKPEKYPASLDVFLRLMMPKKKRRQDRLEFFRKYISDSERVNLYMKQYHGSGQPFSVVPVPRHEEVEKIVAKYQEAGFDESWFWTTADFFRRWLADFEAKNRKQKSSKGGQTLKEKRAAEINKKTENNS